MLQTYKSIRPTAEQVNINDMSELIEIYETNNDGHIISYVIARIFYLNYGYINNLAQLYSTLSDDIKGSIALNCIEKTLKRYDKYRTAKFMTLFARIYKNELYTEMDKYNAQKRKLNNESCSLDDYESLEEDNEKGHRGVTYNDNITNISNLSDKPDWELKDYIDNSDLTNLQKDICKTIIDYKAEPQKGLQKDVADIVGISPAYVSIQLKNIKNSEVFEDFI